VRHGEAATPRYPTGFRFGGGPALAMVLAGDLVERWRMFQACRQGRGGDLR
jgi:D-lactate dehydrogenase